MLTEDQIKILKKTTPSYDKNIFPPTTNKLFDDELVGLIGQANRAIGNLNSYARIIPNPDLLIWPLLLNEALASSKIEGTQASIKDILNKEANLKTKAEDIDIQEVINHREATKLGLKLLDTLPIANRLIKLTHKRLMDGIVRGSEKRSGEYRQGQNAIGREIEPIDIRYFPPDPLELDNLMHRLEIYINAETIKYDKLVSCAIMHYEFEAIHPFADGNGRIGRLLITLYLLKEGVLKYPLIYPSGYFLHFKEEYDLRLLEVSTKNEWSEWIKFFLKALIEQANKSEILINKIDRLYQESKEKVRLNSQSQHSQKLLEIVFTTPIVKAVDISKKLKTKHRTSIMLLRKLAELEILKYDTNKKKNIIFKNQKLIELL